MEVLGYYPRGISAAVSGEILTFWIRGFLCTRFGSTATISFITERITRAGAGAVAVPGVL